VELDFTRPIRALGVTVVNRHGAAILARQTMRDLENPVPEVLYDADEVEAYIQRKTGMSAEERQQKRISASINGRNI